jgi:hypothetical protein
MEDTDAAISDCVFTTDMYSSSWKQADPEGLE